MIPSSLLLVVLMTQAAETCKVQGRPQDWTGLRVTVPGAEPFEVALGNAEVTVSLSALDKTPTTADKANLRVQVHVETPLVFDATAELAAVPLHAPKSALKAAGGVIRLGPGTRLVAFEILGDKAKVIVQGLEEVLSPFFVPCETLTLGDSDRQTPSMQRIAGEGILPGKDEFELFGEDILLHAVPEGPEPYLIREPSGSRLWVRLLAKREPWRQVELAWDDGTRLVGWARAEQVRKPHMIPQAVRPGRARSICNSLWSPTFRKGTLKPGAELRVTPDGPVWATVSRAVRATVDGNTGWIQLIDMEGLSRKPACEQGIAHAFVNADALGPW